MLGVVVVWWCLWAAVGGTSLKEEESVFPISKNGVPVCLGTAVAVGRHLHLVTAARCVYGVPNFALAVNLNGKEGQFEAVKGVIVHPYYAPPSPEYDIALVKVAVPETKEFSQSETPGELNYLALVKVQPKGNVTGISWNLKEAGSKAQKENAVVEDRKSCRAKLNMSVSTRMLCANLQVSSVPGGSPLLVPEGIVGVASYSAKGNQGNLPTIFTNIANSEIYSFIERYT